jgi:aspartyl protease family protein
MPALLVFSALVLIIAVFVPKLYSPRAAAPETAAVAMAPESQTQAYGRTVTIRRSDNGHYMTEAVVDGRRLDFLVDTGASVIALRERDAARLGIHPVARDYTAQVSTANGMVRAARVDLNRVEVGGVVVRDVAALVLPDEALGQNLLGMSFLSRLRWEQKNGRLILEQ